MMMKRRIALSAFLALIPVVLMTFPLMPVHASPQSSNRTIPQNTLFMLELLSPISTARNQKGDTFRCKVIAPNEYRSAIVDGELTKVKASRKVKGKSEIAMAFRSITLPNGDTCRFEAQIKEVYELAGASNQGQANNEGEVKAKSYRKRDALRISLATGIGALIGGVVAGKQGAVIGALIGGGLTAAGTLKEKGPDLEFSDGTRFVVVTAGR